MRPNGLARPCGSAIYYLLTSGLEGFSAFHRLQTDEVYHFYCGDPVELHLLGGDGAHALVLLGTDFVAGQVPEAVAPALTIQGSHLVPGGRWALLGATMAPAFVPEGFSLSGRVQLTTAYPAYADLIESLSRA